MKQSIVDNNISNFISICYACKNRHNNLIQSIKSIINNNTINDIVIVDWNTDEINLYELLKSEIQTNSFWKINYIKIIDNVPWILSYAYNISFIYAKNNNIIKSDCDYIFSNKFIDLLSEYDNQEQFYSFDYNNAITENQKHLNGFFYFNKKILNKSSYFNHNILFYGYDDCYLKECFEKAGFIYNRLKINDSDLYHLQCNNQERVKNQNNYPKFEFINFFGYNIKNLSEVSALILYNKLICELYHNITTENNVLDIFSIKKNLHKYSEIELKDNFIPIYDTNCNYKTNYKSICQFEIFEKMLELNCWSATGGFLNHLIKEYNIIDVKDKIRLFYILNFSTNQIKNENNCNLVFSLYNEANISRSIELLYCFKENLSIESIRYYHILLEKSTETQYFIKDVVYFLINNNSNIKVYDIECRPTYNYIFDFVNNNIDGTIILTNSDIVFDNSLDILKHLKDEQFISLTRYNLVNGNSELISFEHNGNVNILSQDTWIFKSPMKYKLNNVMSLGTFFCDSYMNYVLSQSQYKCFNLYNDIITYHIQNSLSGSNIVENNSLSSNIYYNLKNKIENFNTLGLELNTFNDYINNVNYNVFKSWDDI